MLHLHIITLHYIIQTVEASGTRICSLDISRKVFFVVYNLIF